MAIARATSQSEGITHPLKLDVLGVRVLSDMEAAQRSPDYVGTNVAVRFRLSVGPKGIWLLTTKRTQLPITEKVQWLSGGMVWRSVLDKGKLTKTPDAERLRMFYGGEWRILPAHSAIEWEEVSDSTNSAGDKYGVAVFLKSEEKNGATYLLSTPYVVPPGKE